MTLTSTSSITDIGWAQHLFNASGRDRIVEYNILEAPGSGYAENAGVSAQEAAFIRSVFTYIDSITGLTFRETNDFRRSDIDVISVNAYANAGTLGETEMQPWGFVVSWLDELGPTLTIREAETILHEIGHTIGLDHPFDDGFYAGATSGDSVMSYNDFDPAFNGFSALDIAAIRQMWA